MDEALESQLSHFKDELLTVGDEVSAALESDEEERQLAAWQAAEALARRWSELKPEVPEGDRARLERRIIDMRRAAEGLSKRASGRATKLAVDAGVVPFLLNRAPGSTVMPPHAWEGHRERQRFSVGADVDAWCGKCRDVREHRIVAMVGSEPKQVLCQTCNSRHNYRLDPPARAATSGAAPAATVGGHKRAPTAEERESQRRQEARRVLSKELAEAADPRPFDPKGRYKAGEIIAHPEHGRGKIENVLKGSLLVRFVDGLRPLNLS